MLDFEGRVYRADGSTVTLASARHKLTYHPGTRRLSGGQFTLVHHDGSEEVYSFEVACEPSHPQGFGYTRGWSDGGNPGRLSRCRRTTSTTASTSPTRGGLAGPDYIPAARRLGGTEFADALHGTGRGSRGMAHVEHMIYPPYEPYGFTA